ncbi:MAG: transporter substrate-binding domain-containing protein [Gammaproteobacteria bacterium]|jgi:polar amino acid transport system substrate-binding protein|nr:transporter substrate-binding domain-containing protein [Gammaproteobacteria bacterium]MBT3472893.1 transporter substrate-binding domain-containing protein [Gammaproteobacteria bacterium]MBT4079420.1 transporter substrate-binding domain-containing protein [Gammaproteobacteria bacterium]MBT4330053.1 transporter substrate-binding domain-containing protein [Gammaproteobacteria bacterium]MBT6080855.1 transporter substrate-binding domain-containing protein [Gammaproteobacteria bacterium]
MRKVILFLYMLLIPPLEVMAEEVQVQVYADQDYPPYSYIEQGEVKGIYTEVVKRVFDRMEGYRVSIAALPWKRGLSYIEQGKGFAIFPPYHRPQQRPYIWPYSMPILDERVVVFCTEEVLNRLIRPNWPEDYYGLKIANNAGYKLGGDAFWSAVKAGKIKLQESGGNRSNLMKLGLKRVDCYMNDRISILFELKNLKSQGLYDEGGRHARLAEGATITLEQGFLGITDRDGGAFSYKEDFLKKFNTVIYEMRKSGELNRILESFVGAE